MSVWSAHSPHAVCRINGHRCAAERHPRLGMLRRSGRLPTASPAVPRIPWSNSKHRCIFWQTISIFQKALCVRIPSLSGTLMRHRAQAQPWRSHIPQLFTVFPLRLSSAGGQKCDFCKSHSRREHKVVHAFLDYFFSKYSWYLSKMKKKQCTAVFQISHLLYLSKFNRY